MLDRFSDAHSRTTLAETFLREAMMISHFQLVYQFWLVVLPYNIFW
jgi:hypothetical protein